MQGGARHGGSKVSAKAAVFRHVGKNVCVCVCGWVCVCVCVCVSVCVSVCVCEGLSVCLSENVSVSVSIGYRRVLQCVGVWASLSALLHAHFHRHARTLRQGE